MGRDLEDGPERVSGTGRCYATVTSERSRSMTVRWSSRDDHGVRGPKRLDADRPSAVLRRGREVSEGAEVGPQVADLTFESLDPFGRGSPRGAVWKVVREIATSDS